MPVYTKANKSNDMTSRHKEDIENTKLIDGKIWLGTSNQVIKVNDTKVDQISKSTPNSSKSIYSAKNNDELMMTPKNTSTPQTSYYPSKNSKLEHTSGYLKFFNQQRQYGFLITNENESIFFHYDDVKHTHLTKGKLNIHSLYTCYF